MSSIPIPAPLRQVSASPLPVEGEHVPAPSSSPLPAAASAGAAGASSAMDTDTPAVPHSYPVLSAEDERRLFTRVYDPTLKADALLCVLPQKWVDSWVAYTGFDRAAVDNRKALRGGAPKSDSMQDDEEEEPEAGVRRGGGERPGYIDCSILLAEPPAHIDLSAPAPAHALSSSTSSSSSSAAAAAASTPSTPTRTLRSSWVQLRSDLQEGVDFTLLNYDAYMRLCEWYGCSCVIIRKVILVGLSQVEMVDLHPQILILTPLLPDYATTAPSASAEEGQMEGQVADSASSQNGGRVIIEQRRVKTFPKSLQLRDVIEDSKPASLIAQAQAQFDAEQPRKDKEGRELPKLGVRERVEGRVWKLRAPVAPAEGAAAPAAAAPGGAAVSPAAAPAPAVVASVAAVLPAPEFVRTWEICTKVEMESKLEYLELEAGTEFILEYRLSARPWSRTGTGLKDDWADMQVKDIVDCLDPESKWFEAEIMEVHQDPIKGKAVKVHFLGWSTKYDEVIVLTPENLAARFAPKNTWTNGPHVYVPKKPVAAASVSNDPYGSYFRMGASNTAGTPDVRGAVGLRNLGNTCFFNSTLQCLANSPGLTSYFTEGKYLKFINRVNPLGFKGKIAEEYAALMAEMWSGKYSVVTPRGIKQVVGEFSPRFSGYAQQDSSEVLSFLMDGLHEDLNRVLKKPATQPVEYDRPDEIVAKESWDRHLERNKSVIVDNFQGQLKSCVVCPRCSRKSVTFDPFMFLTVPLPFVSTRELPLILVSNGVVAPSAAAGAAGAGAGSSLLPNIWPLTIPKGEGVSIAEVKQDLCGLVSASPPGASAGTPSQGLSPACILMVEVYQHRIYKVLANDAPSSRINKQDLIVSYHIPELKLNAGSPTELFTTLQCIHLAASKPIMKRLGIPMVVALPTPEMKAMSMLKLRDIIRGVLGPWLNGGRGWGPGDEDQNLYNIVLLDRSTDHVIHVLPYTDPATGKEDHAMDLLDLCNSFHSRSRMGTSGMSFGLEWKIAPAALNDKLVQDPEQLKYPAHILAARAAAPKKNGLDLADCLAAFSKEETLRKSEAWYCSKCKDHMEATKKVDLFKLPDVLIINLKRFVYDSYRRDKIDAYVDFPVEGLDLSPFMVNSSLNTPANTIYDLYAVSNHYGGMGGGHYTAYCKNLINGRWYNLDDSSVSPIANPSSVRTPAAYVLFYKKRSAKFNAL